MPCYGKSVRVHEKPPPQLRQEVVSLPPANLPGVEEDLPIGVVPNEEWERELHEARDVGCLVDRHLDYEARGRLLLDFNDFQPAHLCPEQRVQMGTDICAAQQHR